MFKDIVKYGLSEGVVKIAPFFVTLLVAGALSPGDFGKYSYFIVIYEVIFIFISFNIQATTRIDFFKSSKKSFYLIKQNHFVVSLFVCLIFLLASVFFESEIRNALIILSLAALFRTGSVFILAVFQCEKSVNSYMLVSTAYAICLASLTLLFIEFGHSYLSWVYAILLASIIQFLIAMKLKGFSNYRGYLDNQLTFGTLKIALVPALLFMPQAIGWWLKSGADRLLIFKYKGEALLGNYSLAFQFASILIIAISTINLVLVPKINENLKVGRLNYTLRILLVTSVFSVLLALILTVASNTIIDLYYSSEYPFANLYLPYLYFSNIIQALLMLYINVLYFEGEGKYVANIILFSFASQVVINFLLLSYFDQSVVTIITMSAICNFVIFILVVRRIKKIVNTYRGKYV